MNIIILRKIDEIGNNYTACNVTGKDIVYNNLQTPTGNRTLGIC